ncbi:putative ABC transporter permease subunit [Alkaliphilus transvaalensis]|uniref:putative ABC transporter permease subunit n=1 Tax=Alkaliphilus transvaalensis TaxID=114628 RepID=UPI00047D887C|nr:hypothetical protein [Alkaliphilus transvaalensis]
MKNKTLTLAKILVKNGEGFGIGKGKGKSSKVMLIILTLSLAPLFVGFTKVLLNIYNLLFTIGQEGTMISWGLAMLSLIIFVFGIVYIISSFYLSTDIENLLHIPLRPKQIVGAKFLVVTFYEYIITAFFYLPILFVYGIKSSAGLLYYIYGMVVFFLIPILPLAAASILVMVIMRFTNVTKNKDAFKLVGGLIAFFLAMGANVMIQKFTMNLSPDEVEALLSGGENSLVALTSGIFPTVKYATEALLNHQALTGLYQLLIYVTISIIVYVILISLGELLYFKGVVGISEGTSKRNSQKPENFDQSLRKSSVIKTYTLSEIKLLIRTPIYFMNCILMTFIWPVFFLFPLLTNSIDFSMLAEIGEFLKDPQWAGKAVAAVFGAMFFISSMSGITSTSISREGQGLFVKKYLPVSYRDQITAKVLSGFIIGILGMLMAVVFIGILLRPPIYLLLLVLTTAWIPILLLSFTGIFIDLFNPKLDWDTEQKAVKQNLNLIYNLLISLVLGGITLFPIFKFNLGLLSTMLVLIGITGGLNLLVYKLLYTKGVNQFAKLEG